MNTALLLILIAIVAALVISAAFARPTRTFTVDSTTLLRVLKNTKR